MVRKRKDLTIRLLKKVDFTVFCVDKDQKTYYNKRFNVLQPYSSGQQVKRSFMEEILEILDLKHCPVTMYNEISDKGTTQKEVIQLCDPSFVDQLIGGWMSSPSKKNKNETDGSYKRRSPLSISAMAPLHPLLGNVNKEDKMVFDRTNVDNDKVLVYDKGEYKDVNTFLNDINAKISKRKLIEGKNRASGLFNCVFTLDLSRLFRVSINKNGADTEISLKIIEKLKKDGWTEIENRQGKWLELPKKYHAEYAEAIADGLVNWKITSNQSRTHDLMPNLSIAVSFIAHEVANSFRGELDDSGEKMTAKLVVDDSYPNTKIFSEKNLHEELVGPHPTVSGTANSDAIKYIKEIILDYYK